MEEHYHGLNFNNNTQRNATHHFLRIYLYDFTESLLGNGPSDVTIDLFEDHTFLCANVALWEECRTERKCKHGL